MALIDVLLLTVIGVAFIFSCFFQGTLTSDVPDDTVYTDGQKTVRMGDSVVLTCRFRGSPLAVYWKKGDDPRRAPNLVSWIPTDSVTGKCEGQRPCEIMEMNEDRSLVIKEVSIAEEGRYICRVLSYKGILIHNFTDIRVFSPPSEPYPLIEECQGEPVSNAPQSCSLSAFDSVTITCTASNYFPDIDLFFLHETITTNAEYLHIGEETNVDGTKNKSVSIVARPSENPYLCVASRIPGSQDQRTVIVTVYSTVALTTTETNQTTSPRQRHEASKVVVPPILIILVAVLVCIFIWWYRKRRASNYGKGDLESALLPPMQDIKDLEVPEYLRQEISPDEIQKCVYRLAERHVRRLATAAEIRDEKQISIIIEENKDVLWVVEQMINDWLIGQECGNYEKRCKLDDAIIEIGRHDMTDSFGTTSYRAQSGDDHKREHSYANYFDCSSLFDDDIESLLRNLPSGAIPMFLEKLGISRSQGDDDVGERLRCWRDQRIGKPKGCSLQETTAILIDNQRETNNNYAFILNDDDLENVVTCVTSQKQIEELTKKLGIKPVKAERSTLENLKQWRDKSEDKERRGKLKKALRDIELSGSIADRLPEKIVYQVEFVRLAWAMFSADVSPLVTTLDMEMGKRTSQPRGTVDLLSRLFKKSKTIIDTYRRRDFCIALRKLGYHDVARMSYYGYDASVSELCNMALGLSEQEILKVGQYLELANGSFLVSDGGYDIVTFTEIWKGQHSAEPVHYRLKLSLGLHAAEKTELARKILAGDYGTVAVNPDVVKSICNGMGNGQLERLAEHLRLNAKGDNPVDTLALVIEWATKWFSKFESSSFFESFKDKIKDKLVDEVKSRKECIDNLYKAGFVRFAEELMLLEVSRLRPIKQVVDEPCESENQETSEQNLRI